MAADPRSTIASLDELDSLMDHVRNMEFRNYPMLNEGCKKHLMGFLDGQSLIRIGRCSKTEKRLADGIRWNINHIEIKRWDNNIEMVRFYWESISRVLPIWLRFKQVENDVIVEDQWTRRTLWEQKDSVYFKEAVQFFEHVLKKCNYEVENIKLMMSEAALEWAGREGSPIERLPNLRNATLGRMDANSQKLWLGKMPEQLKNLDLKDAVTSEILELPQSRNAQNIAVNCDRCDITDAQFLQLKAVSIRIDEAPLLTTNGVNAFLKRWQNGGGVVGFYTLDLRSFGDGRARLEDILDDLDPLMASDNSSIRKCSIPNKVRTNESLDFWTAARAQVVASVYRNEAGCYQSRRTTVTTSKKAASEEELQSLKDHFKDLGFPKYPHLIEDAKRQIMGLLDGPSLIRIGRCSKADNQLSAEIRWKIDHIVFATLAMPATGWEETAEPEMVRFCFGGGPRFEVYFQQIGTDVVAKESPSAPTLWEQKDNVHSKEAVLFFEHLLKKSHYGVKSIHLEMGQEACKWANRDDGPVRSLPHVRSALLQGMSSNAQKFWLKKMPENLGRLEMKDSVASEMLEVPQLCNARRITCTGQCNVTDAQLLHLKAVGISIRQAPFVTTRGVNAFFKRWQAGGGVAGFRRLELWSFAGGRARLEDVLDGLDARIEWNDGFDAKYSIPNKVRTNESFHFLTNPAARFLKWISASVNTKSQE